MNYDEIINEITAQLRDIEEPRARRFVAEQSLLRTLGIPEGTLVGVNSDRGKWILTQDHPAVKDAEAFWDGVMENMTKSTSRPKM